MKIPFYTAMTGQEMEADGLSYTQRAWLSAHFDSNGNGISNLPEKPFHGSILILDDLYPFDKHNEDKICSELYAHITSGNYEGVLLDLQRDYSESLCSLVRKIEKEIPCKVGITPPYCTPDSIVFLPPITHTQIPAEYLTPWKGHEIWLDMCLKEASLTVSEESPVQSKSLPEKLPYYDEALYTHYNITKYENGFIFTFRREYEDCTKLLEEAGKYGVSAGFCLLCEIKKETAPINRGG